MHRIDVRELNHALQSLARLPILSAFRYQRSAAAPAGLALDVKRFADAGVLAAVADRAVATTLVTTEGRALTEIVADGAEPRAAVPEGHAAGGRVDRLGGRRRRSREAGARRRRDARAAPAPGLPSAADPTRCRSSTCTPGRRSRRKGEMQMTLPRMDMPVGHRRMGSVRARQLFGARHRRQRHRSTVDRKDRRHRGAAGRTDPACRLRLWSRASAEASAAASTRRPRRARSPVRSAERWPTRPVASCPGSPSCSRPDDRARSRPLALMARSSCRRCPRVR